MKKWMIGQWQEPRRSMKFAKYEFAKLSILDFFLWVVERHAQEGEWFEELQKMNFRVP